MASLDESTVKKDFPILSRKFNGNPLVYLDSAATSQKPNAVINAITAFYKKHNANVHRGVYELSVEATGQYEGSRKKISEFVGAKPNEIVFTRNATEAINLVAYSMAQNKEARGSILLTQMEHHSNIVPWQMACKQNGNKLLFVPIKADGTLDLDSFSALLEENEVSLVAFTHASNVLGTINPVKEMVRTCRKLAPGAKVLIDAAQSVPHLQVDFDDIGADFLAFSGHKMLGPTGTGCLVGRLELLEQMPPFLYGGDMIRKVDWQVSDWNEVPWKFEAGTPDVAGAVGLGAAADYLNSLRMKKVREHEIKLTSHAMKLLGEIEGVKIYGPLDAKSKTGVVSFNVGKIHSHDVASVLDGLGIAVRAGHHCAMPLMKAMNAFSTARASFYVYNDIEDIDKLAQGIRKVVEVFSR